MLLSNVWIRYDIILVYKYFRFDRCNSTTSRRWGMTAMHGGSQIIQLLEGEHVSSTWLDATTHPKHVFNLYFFELEGSKLMRHAVSCLRRYVTG